jgi:hypothetical protein
METMSKWLVVAAAACLATPGFADDNKTSITIAPYAGGAHVRMDAENMVDGERHAMDLLLAGVSIGVRIPIGLTFEIGRSDAVHDDLSDWNQEGFQLAQRYIAVGWQFNLGDDWTLAPKYGRAKWSFDADDVNFVDRNGDVTDKVRGYDNFGEITLAKKLSDSFSLGLTVRGLETDFGDSYSGALTAGWSL